jgi:hypothetical protein
VSNLDLGSVDSARPATDCSTGGFLIEVERLRPGPKVDVEREVALVRDRRVTQRWSIDGASLFVPFRRFASRGDTAIMILPVQEGLQVWRWRLR